MNASPDYESSDTEQADLGFGHGGVPWYLMLFYLAFLGFFVWYSLEFQLPDFQSNVGGGVEAPQNLGE